MRGAGQGRRRTSGVSRYTWLFMAGWTVVLGAELAWNASLVRDHTRESARIQARTAYDKDVLYRRWNAGHGGVYAPVTTVTQPNPYLEDVSEREVRTPSGRLLTLVNPAYMTRQVHTLARGESGVLGHITSLDPIRPENRPDPWEVEALSTFGREGDEYSSVESVGGKYYLRLMRPLLTEAGCLPCHEAQGYREGEVRGGISVSVPMAPLREKESKLLLLLTLGHLFLWGTGAAVILSGGRKLAENARRLEEANRSKELFTDIVSHDIRGPAAVVEGYTEHLLRGEEEGERKDLLEKISGSCRKLKVMIDRAALYSRLDSMEDVERTELDLSAVLGQAVESLVQEISRKDLSVDLRTDGPLPVKASPLIGNVFSNILSNAVRYSPEGGRIEVRADGDGGERVIRITDHGPGISREGRQRLFARFERLGTEKGGGLGLGLAIARRLTELHGGSIGVEERPGGGSTFIVRLPGGNQA